MESSEIGDSGDCLLIGTCFLPVHWSDHTMAPLHVVSASLGSGNGTVNLDFYPKNPFSEAAGDHVSCPSGAEALTCPLASNKVSFPLTQQN